MSSMCKRLTFQLGRVVSRKGTIKRHISNTSVAGSDRLEWSYAHGHAKSQLLGATIGQLVTAAAEKYGNDEAYVSVHQGLRYSFVDLLEKSDDLAAGLMSLGVRPGDRVGIWAPNVMEWVITQFGTARAGIILVNINPGYRVNEVNHALKKVGVKVLVATETFKASNYYGMLQEIIPDLATSGSVQINSTSLPELKHIVMISDKQLKGTIPFEDVMGMGDNKLKQDILDMQHKLQFDDIINIQFTSGTTGLPKGASLSHHNIVNNSKYCGELLHYDRIRSRVSMPVPLYHCFGMVLGSLSTILHGTTIVMPSPGFDPAATLKAASDEKCRAVYGTPTMFIDMLEVPDRHQYDLSSLSTGIMAGSPCPIEVMKKVMSELNMKDVTICYGTTENSPVTCQTAMDVPVEKRVSTVGKVHSQSEAKVVDEHGRVVRTGVKGELCIRGYCVMQNYWDDPEKTKEVIGADRWYNTGDLAIMDEEGFIQIVGRMKDLVIRGGENIYPTEIEQFLYKHPKISDVQVIGVPDKRLGEQVCAWIKLKPGETATPDEIKAFCEDKIAHFKIPHYIMFVDEYPMTVTGKIQKFKMRQAATEQLGLLDA